MTEYPNNPELDADGQEMARLLYLITLSQFEDDDEIGDYYVAKNNSSPEAGESIK